MTTWRLLTESGDYLITEAGDQLINETLAADLVAESSVSADLYVQPGFAANAVANPSVTADLTAQITLAADLAAEATSAGDITTAITMAADLAAESAITANLYVLADFEAALVVEPAVTADLTTQILFSATLQAEASSEAFLTTPKLLNAELICTASAGADLSTQIKMAADLAAETTLAAGITTTISLVSALEATPSVSGEIIFYRPIAANLQASATATADLKTAVAIAASLSVTSTVTAAITNRINAMAALVAVANVSNATLKVVRRSARAPKRAEYIYLAEITAYDPDTSAEITWRFSTGQGYNNAGTFYAPRIENPAALQRSINIEGGKQSTSYGELTLINNDGALNALAGDYFDGRTLTLKRGKKTDAYASFTTILKATVETAALERERISLRLRDKTYRLEKAHQTTKYAGTNVLPNGLEGTADDIKGSQKPLIYGRIALMAPTLVNTAKLIYQVNDGAVDAIINVFDSGAYLSRGADYASEAAMLASAPASGEWKAYPAGGYFRLGASAFGQVTTCVAEKWAYLDCSAAGLIERVLADAGFTSDDWVMADFTALDQKNVGSLGIIVGDGETTASIIERICASVGAWWGVDSLNRFRFGRLDAPSGVSAALITDQEIIEIERQPPNRPALWQSTLKADTNFVPVDRKSLAGIVSDERALWLNKATRDQVAEDASVKTARLLAESEEAESSLNGISIADAEASRRLALHSVRRDVVNLTVGDPANQYADIDLGSVVTVTSDQLGYTSGRQMIVTSLRPDYKANTFDMTLWG